MRLWCPVSSEAAEVVGDYIQAERDTEERYTKLLAEREKQEVARDRSFGEKNPRGTFLVPSDGSTNFVTSHMDERVRQQLEPNIYFSARAPRRYGEPGENLGTIDTLEPGTSAVPLRADDWADIRQERLAQEAERARTRNIMILSATLAVPGPEDLAAAALFGTIGRGTRAFQLAGEFTPAPKGILPHGFYSADEFANFGDELRAGLRGIGIDDAQGILQGSSVTGVRRFSKPGIPAGTPFDAIQTSDFDVAISSRQLLQRADSLGIPLRGRDTRSQPLSPLDLEALGLQDLPGNLRQRLFSSSGRDINFIITDSAETAFSRGPSIRIPTR
jgi:hypothetical protein